MSLSLWFAGGEIPSHRSLLAEMNVSHISLSYMGLRRRTKFTKPFILDEKFPAEQQVFLDSGAYTVNKQSDKYTHDELVKISDAYIGFVHQNLDRISMVSEFDAQILGQEWIEAMREDFYDDIEEDKFLPIWHGEQGIEALDAIAQRYSRIGVPQTVLSGRNLAPTLNGIVQKYGTKLHGIAMTKPDEMAAVKWDSVSSTSWISPSQFGDTVIWTGNELKRYPMAYKEQSRKRHRSYINQIGFDAAKIEADDTTEVLKLSIWSWQQLVANIERHKPVTTSAKTAEPPNAETPGAEVDTYDPQKRNSAVAIRQRDPEEIEVMPGFEIDSYVDRYTDAEGVRRERNAPLMRNTGTSLRVCDTCFLKDKCPKFEPGANCAYKLPIEIRTKEQLRSLQDVLVEMQAQRVAFMRMAEDMEGGYADPNLSGEMDRLQRIIDRKDEMEREGFSLTIQAKQRGTGDGGMISRLFGKDAGQQAQQLPEPISVESVNAYMDPEYQNITDAELLDG